MKIGMRWGALFDLCTEDRDQFDTEHTETCVDLSCRYPPPIELAGLALFAALMGLVECAMHCPLMFNAEGERTWNAANRAGTFAKWEDLSEASRQHWMHCLVSASFNGLLNEVLR
jgi:hypothetical protein